MRCIPTSATPRSAARSTARSRRWSPNCRTATRSRSSPRRRRPRRRRPGSRSSSPARRAPRSGARPASRCARNMSGFGRRIVERLFQRAKKEYSDEKLQGALPRLARASIEDVMAAVGRGEMKASDVARAMYPDYKEERVARVRDAEDRRAAGSACARRKSLIFKVPDGKDADGRDPDPRHQQRPAGALRAERRRGAGRPHRRHHDAGRGDHDLSDPVAGAEGVRGHAGALARRALGRRGGKPAALPGAHQVQSVNEPGSLAQIAQVIAEHDGNIDNIRMTRARAGLHRAADRSRGLRPQAPQRDHRAAAAPSPWWRRSSG